MSAAERIGYSIEGPSPLTKSNARPIGVEREQQVREEDGGVDVDGVDGLQRDRDGQFRRAAELEEGVPLAQRPVVGHVAAGLAHEPDRRALTGWRRQARRKRSFTGDMNVWASGEITLTF